MSRGERTAQHPYDLVLNRALETCVILLTSVTPVSSAKTNSRCSQPRTPHPRPRSRASAGACLPRRSLRSSPRSHGREFPSFPSGAESDFIPWGQRTRFCAQPSEVRDWLCGLTRGLSRRTARCPHCRPSLPGLVSAPSSVRHGRRGVGVPTHPCQTDCFFRAPARSCLRYWGCA